MIQPATLPLFANRWTPFTEAIAIYGADLSAATFKMQVRALPDSTGTPLADLGNAISTAEGVSCTTDSTGLLPISTVVIRINQSTMATMPAAPELGSDLEVYWDLHVTRAGFLKVVFFRGKFTIRAGVTQ